MKCINCDGQGHVINDDYQTVKCLICKGQGEIKVNNEK